MSHFQSYECNVSNEEFIKKALVDMGLGYEVNALITDYYRNTIQSEIAVVSRDKLLPLGWIRNEETNNLELQADWYKVPFPQRKFIEDVEMYYAKHQVLETCKQSRWNVNESDITINTDGCIEVLATQFA